MNGGYNNDHFASISETNFHLDPLNSSIRNNSFFVSPENRFLHSETPNMGPRHIQGFQSSSSNSQQQLNQEYSHFSNKVSQYNLNPKQIRRMHIQKWKKLTVRLKFPDKFEYPRPKQQTKKFESRSNHAKNRARDEKTGKFLGSTGKKSSKPQPRKEKEEEEFAPEAFPSFPSDRVVMSSHMSMGRSNSFRENNQNEYEIPWSRGPSMMERDHFLPMFNGSSRETSFNTFPTGNQFQPFPE